MKQKYQLQTLTPVHIGSGETLNQIDGYSANDRWYHIDLDRILADPSTDINALTSEMSQRDFRWHRYLSQRNIEPSEVSYYSLCVHKAPKTSKSEKPSKRLTNAPIFPVPHSKGHSEPLSSVRFSV